MVQASIQLAVFIFDLNDMLPWGTIYELYCDALKPRSLRDSLRWKLPLSGAMRKHGNKYCSITFFRVVNDASLRSHVEFILLV